MALRGRFKITESMVIIIAFVITVVSFVVAIGVLVLYGLSLGSISNKAEDWAAFGSVLAGAFTLLGALATASSLVVVSMQFRMHSRIQVKHDEITKKQIDVLTFEHYIRHRKQFNDLLVEQEEINANEIKFHNPDALYRRIYPYNNPNYCKISVEVIEDDEGSIELKKCMKLFEEITSLICRERDKIETLDLILKIEQFQFILGMSYVAGLIDGDILNRGHPTGINVHEIKKSVRRVVSVFNAVLLYSGNEQVEFEDCKVNNYTLCHDTYGMLMGRFGAYNNYSVMGGKNLFCLKSIHDKGKTLNEIEDKAFSNSLATLNKLFSSSGNAVSMLSVDSLECIVSGMHEELCSVEERLMNEDKALEYCSRIRTLIQSIDLP